MLLFHTGGGMRRAYASHLNVNIPVNIIFTYRTLAHVAFIPSFVYELIQTKVHRFLFVLRTFFGNYGIGWFFDENAGRRMRLRHETMYSNQLSILCEQIYKFLITSQYIHSHQRATDLYILRCTRELMPLHITCDCERWIICDALTPLHTHSLTHFDTNKNLLSSVPVINQWRKSKTNGHRWDLPSIIILW